MKKSTKKKMTKAVTALLAIGVFVFGLSLMLLDLGVIKSLRLIYAMLFIYSVGLVVFIITFYLIRKSIKESLFLAFVWPVIILGTLMK